MKAGKVRTGSDYLKLLLVNLLIVITSGLSYSQRFTMTETLSDGAQSTTIAFDGLAFFTGSLGADSFFPPGKVADFWGFQFLRDNDPSEMGHNTDFLTKAAFNMLNQLSTQQMNLLIDLAKKQVASINQYGYNRFVLMKAFRRLMSGDVPAGKPNLCLDSVKAYSASLYKLDGQISYERARIMGGIIASLTPQQRASLDSLKGKGMLTWPNLAEPASLRGLTHDEKVAVMTYGGDIFSWYLGDVEADVYFCPERQGTYFGSFYLKDAPAVGNPGYSIGTNITADYGNNFLNTLTASDAQKVRDLVNIQKPSLYEIVDRRRDVSNLLRQFIAGSVPDSAAVISLMERYGALDGIIVYNYAVCFADIFKRITSEKQTRLMNYRTELIGSLNPTGAYLYASEIAIPTIPNTDFLFTENSTVQSTPVLLSPADTSKGVFITTTFRWTACNGAASYNLQLSTAQDFSTLAVNKTITDSVNYSVSGLKPNTKYYWRVCANVNDASVYSNVWSFTTVGYGDIDANNIVTAYDALLALIMSVGLPASYDAPTIRFQLPHYQLADVDGKHNIGHRIDVYGVSAYDAFLILKRSVGYTDPFPVEAGGPKENISGGNIRFGQALMKPGTGAVSVPLKLSNAKNVNSIIIELKNTDKNSTVKSCELNLPKDWIYIVNEDNGKYNIAMAGLTPLADGTIGTINIKGGSGQNIITGSAVINNNLQITLASENEITSVKEYALHQNYPNPFNPSTVISYSLPEQCKVKITICDILGRQIQELVNETKTAGRYTEIFNAGSLSSGIYFCKLSAEGIESMFKYSSIKKIVLIK